MDLEKESVRGRGVPTKLKETFYGYWLKITKKITLNYSLTFQWILKYNRGGGTLVITFTGTGIYSLVTNKHRKMIEGAYEIVKHNLSCHHPCDLVLG